MAGKLTIELITPEKLSLSEPADFVVLPAFEGEMGVLPGHEPFMVQLMPGEVRVQEGDDTRYYAISGGFAEVTGEKVEIFAETAENAQEIDEERAKQARERAKAEAKKGALDPMTLAQAEAAMRRAEVRLRVAGLRRRVKSKKQTKHR